MLHQIQALCDHIRHLILNPPLAPGGDVTSISASSNSAPSNAETNNNDPFLLRYLPLLVLLSLFWPVLLTLVAASFSASAWLFWLIVGGAFGILQLLFVLYNFVMIFWDVGILTILKTFAMLRSSVRYYTYKMTDAAGIEIKGRGANREKKRRRKEWREDVDRATNFKEYCQIEIYEPTTTVTAPPAKSKYARRTISAGTADAGAPSSGLRRRNTTSNFAQDNQTMTSQQPSVQQSTQSPTKITSSTPSSPQSPMRKSQSCLVLNKTPNKSNRRRFSPSSNNIWRRSPFKRNYSSNSLPNSPSIDEDENCSFGNVENCPKWQKVVEEDLGMAGNMLLTTMERLKEARIQATSMNNFGNRQNDRDENDDNDENSTTSLSSDDDNDTRNLWESSPTRTKSNEDYSSSLKFLLSGIVKRNHLSVDDFLINDARSVAERGQHSLKKETREAINQYGEELERCLEWVASGPVWLGDGVDSKGDLSNNPSTQTMAHPLSKSGNVAQYRLKPNTNNPSITPTEILQLQQKELSKRLTLVKRMKQNMGRTALMLSGGGAQAMYHLGTIKALVESELYEHIHVISGTSGGSITAAMCAINSPAELLRNVCVKTVSTDYMHTGEMKQKDIRWFPRLIDMGAYWLKHRVLADSADFKRCCEFYYKDITFEEAFELTGKHVCITVSASRASSGSGVQRLLLNHISTPNVTLASAVAASCALPGFMAPAKLMIKDSRGKQRPFEVDGVEWIDGSVQADLPFKRISTLFNITNYVVAQTNFHVVPFLNKAHHPNINTLYWKLFQMCMYDVRSRVLNLSQLGLFPRIFGQDVSKIFKQKYYSNLTLVPRFTTMQLFGLKSLVNPTVADMEIYIQNGQIAAWPFLHVLKETIRIERSVDACLAKLEHRVHSVASGGELTLSNTNDEVDSLSAALSVTLRAHLPGLGREAELLKEKVRDLELDNAELRKTVFHLQRALGISPHSSYVVVAGNIGAAVGTLDGQFVTVAPVEEDVILEEDKEEKKVV